MDKLLRFDYITKMSIDKLLNQIDTYNRNWKIKEYLSFDQLNELKQLATVQSVGSSTRIEGSRMDDDEVSELIEYMYVQKLTSRDKQEVAGYFATLEIIQAQYRDLELTENLIKALHKELMRFSDKDIHHRGAYKQLSNQVVAKDKDGNQRVVFETTSPLLTPMAMEKAVAWYQMAKAEDKRHPLIRIGAFIYEFLTIHPFQDGNGRLSRLLTTMLLLQEGYEFILYASLERKIEEDKATYYKVLMAAQRHRGTDEEQISKWMYFLLHSIRQLTDGLKEDEQSIVEEPAAIYLNTRQRKVLDFIRREGTLSVSEIDALLPTESRNTLKYDLKRMTEAKILIRRGQGRGTVYEYKGHF